MDNPPFIDDLLYPLRPSFTGHVQSPRLVVPRYCRYVVGWLSLSKPLVSGVWPKQDLNDLNVATLYFLISSSSGPDLQESKNHKNPDLVFSFFFSNMSIEFSIDILYSTRFGMIPNPQWVALQHQWGIIPSESRDAIFGSLPRHISKWPSISATLGVLFLNTVQPDCLINIWRSIILYYIHLFLIHISGM